MKIWKIDSKEKFLNEVLETKEEKLIEILVQRNKEDYYGEPIIIPKKNGNRYIYAVDSNNKLYYIQKKLVDNFLSNIQLPEVTYGFRKNFNYFDYLAPHINFYKNNMYLRLDIKDFFGSIKKDMIQEALKYYIPITETLSEQDRITILSYIFEILTFNNIVIQGAPSSPVISNIIFRPLDIRIFRYCKCFHVNYTRYADDMLFSSENKTIFNKSFLMGIAKIINDGYYEFYLNYDKIVRSSNQISLGGFVISDTIRISRKKLAQLSRVLFYVENHTNYKDKEYYKNLNDLIEIQDKASKLRFNNIYSLINYLAGNRAFLINVLRYSKDIKFCEKTAKIINRLNCVILNLYNVIES